MQLPQSFQQLQSAQRFPWHLRHAVVCGVCTLVLLTASTSVPGAERLVRIQNADSEYTGKIVALSQSRCTLMDRQGRLVELDIAKIKEMERLSERFRADSTSTFRADLGREFGRGYEVAGTTHYLVCTPRGQGGKYADLFEKIYRDVEQFYRVRGFRVSKPDVPLVAVVFATQKEFVEYCVKDGVPPSPGLQGYYSLVSNRVALFDTSGAFRSVGIESTAPNQSVVALSGITGQTASTIVHETIHQVGYNIGIHTRLGETPLWIVEGLATVLEPSRMRNRRSNQDSSRRVNPERYEWFRKKYRPQRPAGSLARLIASNRLFQQQTLSAYSEAWALTFFLLENPARRKNFATYLQNVTHRDATKQYPAKERLADFQSVFGDIARLEVEFLRYMDRM